MANRSSESKNWLTTLPGLLTAIGALITAIGGFIVVLNTKGCLQNSKGEEDEKKYTSTPGYFIEDFQDNINGWYLDEAETHSVNILNGKLYITCKAAPNSNAGYTSSYSRINLRKFYPKYRIDLACNYISGEKGSPFGFILSNENYGDESYQEFYQINYFINGFGNMNYIKGQKTIATAENGVGIQKTRVTLTFKVIGDDYKYYIDNKLIDEGKLRFFDFYTVRPFVSRTQTIEFDKLEITPL